MSRLAASAVAVALLALAAGAAPGPALAAGLQAEARLEPEAIRPDGLARLVIVVQGPGFRQPRLQPYFELDNLEIVAGPDRRQEVQLGTAGSGWRQTFTWHLRPLGMGAAGVDAIHVEVGDQVLALAPRRLRVTSDAPEGEITPDGRRRDRLQDWLRVPRGLPSRRQSAEDGRSALRASSPQVFLRAVAAPLNAYVGQRVVYTVYLYTQIRVASIEAETIPDFAGMWARTVDREAHPEQVEWQGDIFTRVPLLEKYLYPMRPGAQTVDPIVARLMVETLERRGFLRAPVVVPQQISRASNALSFEVVPLPAVAPAFRESFGGAVGELSLAARLEPATLRVGEGAAVTVTLRGSGNLDTLPAPTIRLPPGLELMAPEEVTPAAGEVDEREVAAGAVRSWRYVVVPRRPGQWALPPVEMAYFDPGEGTYRLARANLGTVHALPEVVADGAQAAADAEAQGAAPPVPGAAADADADADAAGRIPPWRRHLPWLAAALLLATLIVLAARWQARRRPATGAGPTPFAAALHEERPRRAAVALEAAWRRHLEERYDLPAGAPPVRWPEALIARGADRADTETLAELLADLHYLRYAPELSATSSLAHELVERSRVLAGRLQGAAAASRSAA